jgi:predicted CXXCH cytochrome family protein
MNKRRVVRKEQNAKSQEIRANYPTPPFIKGSKEGLLFYALCSVLILVWSNFAYAQGELKEKVPNLCYRCHIKLKDRLSSANVHFPFKEGKCTACHNSHAGNARGLVREDINTLCLGCHERIKNVLKQKFVHRALKNGVCTDCHYAHSGENKYLLVKKQKDLCGLCHEALKEQLKNSSVHRPFKDGECSSCHNPHASAEKYQLMDPANKSCRKCHPPKCKKGSVSIAATVEKTDCTSCHSGHSSSFKALLGPFGHTAFLEEKCELCHNPILPDAKITTKMPVKELCLSCHTKDTLKIKDNDVHLTDEKGGCIMCHKQHASKKKNLTVSESDACAACHEKTEKKTMLMSKALKSIKCIPVKDGKCFECHVPPHSERPLYLKEDKIKSCARCHEGQHKITHPLGRDTKDPRDGQPLTCITCHSMHSSKAEFMLYFDRKRQLCIQCHKK